MLCVTRYVLSCYALRACPLAVFTAALTQGHYAQTDTVHMQNSLVDRLGGTLFTSSWKCRITED